jgi:hypothetical protein
MAPAEKHELIERAQHGDVYAFCLKFDLVTQLLLRLKYSAGRCSDSSVIEVKNFRIQYPVCKPWVTEGAVFRKQAITLWIQSRG